MAKRKQKGNELVPVGRADYDGLLSGLSALLDQSRRSAARAVNIVERRLTGSLRRTTSGG